MTGIYLIKNKVNGKCYVGQAMDIEERWKQHIAAAKKPKMYISRAIAKYGADNFDFSVVELCDAEKLNEREIYWIDFYKSFGNNGYNCTIGGCGHNQCKNSYSKEYKSAIKKSWYEDHKEKCRYERKAWYEDHKDDPEFKRKSSEEKKSWYEANKEKVRASALDYYYSHKFTPTPDHTEMPLW